MFMFQKEIAKKNKIARTSLANVHGNIVPEVIRSSHFLLGISTRLVLIVRYFDQRHRTTECWEFFDNRIYLFQRVKKDFTIVFLPEGGKKEEGVTMLAFHFRYLRHAVDMRWTCGGTDKGTMYSEAGMT